MSAMRVLSGQTAFEFAVIFTIFTMLLTVAAWISFAKTQEINSVQLNLEVKNAFNLLGGKINTAFLEGDGYSANVTMPQDIASYDYNVTIQGSQILITLNSITYSSQILTQNVTGTVKKGSNRIVNNKGIIEIY